uniref:Uncharacterized protein n=1 Tax=Erpetoichthys calabaricus TaxID=27687 RepID=A0A8C4SPL2_ERPCA
MIGNKRTLSYMESLGHGKVARLDKMNPQGSGTGLCKARGLPPYSTEDPLNYNGTYFAYYLKGQDGSDVPLRWSPPGPYLHDRRNTVVHPLTSERPLPSGLMYRPEKDLGQAFAPEKTSPLLLGDKWGDFVDRQSKVSHGSGLHAPVAVRKMALGGTAGNAPPEHSVGSLAIPKPLYKTRICCADAECKTRGCVPLEPEAERIQGRPYEADWRGSSAGLCYGALPALDKRTSLLEADSLQLEPSGATRRQSKELGHPGYVPAGHLGAVGVSAFPDPSYNAVPFNGPPHALPVSSHKGCVNVSQPSDVYHHDAPAGLPKGYHEMHVAPHSRLPTPIYQERSPVSKFAHLPQRHLYLCPPGALDLDKSPNYKVLEHQFVNESSSLSPQNIRGSYPPRSERYVYRSPPPPYSAAVSLPYAVIPTGAPSLSSAGRYDLPSYPYKHHHGPGGLKRAFSETAGPPVQMEMADRGVSVAAHKLHVMVPSREFGSYRHGPSAFHPVHGSYGIDNSTRVPSEASAYCQAGIYSDRNAVPGMGQSAAAFPECRRPGGEVDGLGLMDSPRGRPQEDGEGAYAAGGSDGRMDEKQKAAVGEEDTACPSSPPMPVINNVFSLAPYKAYLEASGILPSQSDVKDGAPRLKSPKVEERSEPDGPKQEVERAELGPCKREVETEDAGGYPLKQEDRDVCDAGPPRLFERDIKVEDMQGEDTALDLRVKKPTDGQVVSAVKAEAADESPRANGRPSAEPFALKPSSRTLGDSRPDGAGQVCPLYEQSPLPCLKLSAIKLILPDIVKTAPPSVPDFSLPVGDGSVNEKSQRHSLRYFMELHHSLCKLIDGAIAVCGKEELGSLLAKTEQDPDPDTVPTKPKSIPQILEVFRSSCGKEMSVKSGEISSALSCVLSQLETYIYIRKCPFPHVIRTGTIFIPMLVVKETLFPQLEGALVDQVLQEHRVELRPTTLSEERHLTQVQQRGCSSKLRRLLSLKHLPDIYPDLLKLYCDASLRTHLGSSSPAGIQN